MPKLIVKRIIAENVDIFTELIYPQLMLLSTKVSFHSFLSLRKKILVFKKGSKTSKQNYRPISIFKHVSKLCAEAMI